jgi:hypothetical protein
MSTYSDLVLSFAFLGFLGGCISVGHLSVFLVDNLALALLPLLGGGGGFLSCLLLGNQLLLKALEDISVVLDGMVLNSQLECSLEVFAHFVIDCVLGLFGAELREIRVLLPSTAFARQQQNSGPTGGRHHDRKLTIH